MINRNGPASRLICFGSQPHSRIVIRSTSSFASDFDVGPSFVRARIANPTTAMESNPTETAAVIDSRCVNNTGLLLTDSLYGVTQTSRPGAQDRIADD